MMCRKSPRLAKQSVSILGYSESFGHSLPIFITNNGKTCNQDLSRPPQLAIRSASLDGDKRFSRRNERPPKFFYVGQESLSLEQ